MIIIIIDGKVYRAEPMPELNCFGANVAQAAAEASVNMDEARLKAIRIDHLEMPVRVAHALENADCKTVWDVVQLGGRRLLRTPDFGRVSLSALKDVLSNLSVVLPP